MAKKFQYKPNAQMAPAAVASKNQPAWKKLLNLNFFITLAFIVFIYWLLAMKNNYMVKWYDEMSLFLPGKIFFMEFAMHPGGLLTYLGCFFTQFFYHPYLGTTIILALWLLMALLARFCFGLKGKAYPLSLIIPLILLVSIVQLDEGLMSFKSEGYVFSSTLGFLFTLSAYAVYRLAEDNKWFSFCIGILICLCYGVAGYYALLATLLCIITAVIRGIRQHDFIKYIEAAVLLIALIVLPIFYYNCLPGNLADYDYLYLKGMPPLMMESFDLYLWCPFIMASVVLLAFTFLSAFLPIKARQTDAMKWIAIIAVAVGSIWAVVADRKSEQLRATVLMLKCMELNDWKRIPYIISLTKEEPNYTMSIMSDLAITYLGGQSRNMGAPEPQFKDLRHSENFTMTGLVQVPVNYYIGRFNQSYRWAMEHTAQYGKRAFYFKFMVKDALLRGEIQLAKKYNDLLLSTMYHREWAENMKQYIQNPELIRQNPEFVKALEMHQEEMKRGE